MSNTSQMKAALVGLLGAALILGGSTLQRDTALAMLLFGVVNVVFSPPGTGGIRAVATIGALLALLWHDLLTPVALVAWIVWPPAYMVAWATSDAPDAGDETEQHNTGARARLAVAAVIGAVAIASLVYRGLLRNQLDQTAALFVGVPAILAVVVVLATSPRSPAAVACKAVTVGLLVSLLFLWEGILCVAMSAPLFYLVAISIAHVLDRSRTEYQPRSWVSCIAVLAIVPMSLEGVSDRTSLRRDEEVTQSKIVRASSGDVERALTAAPRFDRVLPLYLRIGFPRPVSTRVERNGDASARWIIRLRGGEMKLNGMEPRAGDLVLELAESRRGLMRWRAVADDSHMTHFLSWRESTVRWEPTGPDTTRVTWTVRYRRGLDPAWYFGPWERYAAGLAAEYLIDAVATP